jgi:hypothetical protein
MSNVRQVRYFIGRLMIRMPSWVRDLRREQIKSVGIDIDIRFQKL